MFTRLLHCPHPPVRSCAPSPHCAEEEDSIPLDTIRVITDFTIRAYSEETARTKDIDAKATPLIAATGTVILFAATSLARPQSGWATGQSRAYFIAVGVCIFILLAALCCFLRVIALRSHPRLPVTSWLEPEDVQQGPAVLLWQMAHTYADAVVQHEAVTSGKLAWFRWGLRLLLGGFLGLVLSLAATSAIDNHPWPW